MTFDGRLMSPPSWKVTVRIMPATVRLPLQLLTCVAAADVDGQRARGAEGRRPAVNHPDGQEVHVLLMAVEA